MMKEFGVELELYEKEWLASEGGTKEILKSFNEFYTNQIDTSCSDYARPVSLVSADFGKIYISKKSEAIFEPKEGDIVDRVDPAPHENFYKARIGDVNAFKKGNWPLRIIIRDNKQFFFPKIEY